MWFVLQNIANHAAARIAGAHLEEDPNAVGIGLFHDFCIINRPKRLAENDIGGTIRCHLITSSQVTAVKGLVLW